MKTSSKKQIVLPGWVFDGLALSAEAFGGIGGSSLDFHGEPWCAIGHVLGDEEAQIALLDAFRDNGRRGNAAFDNNDAVESINRRKGITRDGYMTGLSRRVSFEEWCEELNVVPDYATTGYHGREGSR